MKDDATLSNQLYQSSADSQSFAGSASKTLFFGF